MRQKLFEKEGISAELTIYRSGAETFEGMAAGAADIILDPPSLVSAGRKKGVMSKIVANASMGNFGWQLMVPPKSTLDVKDLNGKKVAITAAGSGSDLLALWTIQDKKIDFTRVPVGGGGLVPNLLAGNVDAAVVYSPLSYPDPNPARRGSILDYSSEVPPNLTAGWIVLDKFAAEAKPAVVQKALNALYGAIAFHAEPSRQTVKLIADLYEFRPTSPRSNMRTRSSSSKPTATWRPPMSRRRADVDGPGETRRPEGHRADGRRVFDGIQAGPNQPLRTARCPLPSDQPGPDRDHRRDLRAMGIFVANRHRQSAAAAIGVGHAGDAG